ncbi:MAG: indole-3-glycerol phosphate synthase TrpC [Bacteroidota bacterium]
MSILDRIVADTRNLVERRKAHVPAAVLEARPAFRAPTLSLADGLRRPAISNGDPTAPPAVIAEIKKASPSEGVIRLEFDVPGIARQYKTAGAAAISVLTEPTHFQGALGNLDTARFATDLPLLRKDFIVDEYQLLEARAFGADAVLLIAAVLDAVELRDLHQTATDLGLSCLVEVYDPRELAKLDLDEIEILGVNNRDLRTFEVDIDHSVRVLERVPDHIVRVSESGLKTADDLAHVRRGGIDAVLIGTAFMRAAKPGDALQALVEGTQRRLASPLRIAV